MLEAAAKANPNNIMVVFRAGIAHLHCGSVEDALTYFHRAIGSALTIRRHSFANRNRPCAHDPRGLPRSPSLGQAIAGAQHHLRPYLLDADRGQRPARPHG